MIQNFIRKLLIYLSFPYNLTLEKNNKKKFTSQLYLRDLAIKIKNKKKNKLLTHDIFSKKVLNIIINLRLNNFLRYSFIQKMFFVHNRFYILFFLLQILKNKKLSKLLKENLLGNPVPYFLYKNSSGNRIRAVFHLLKYLEYKKINSNIFVEIGGGYGCMADIIKKYKKNSKIKYIIFDTDEVILLQYYYLKNLNYNVGFDHVNYDIILISNANYFTKLISKYYKNKIFLISNWAISEMPISFRKKFEKLIINAESLLLSFQSNFEYINNLSYFNRLKKKN